MSSVYSYPQSQVSQVSVSHDYSYTSQDCLASQPALGQWGFRPKSNSIWSSSPTDHESKERSQSVCFASIGDVASRHFRGDLRGDLRGDMHNYVHNPRQSKLSPTLDLGTLDLGMDLAKDRRVSYSSNCSESLFSPLYTPTHPASSSLSTSLSNGYDRRSSCYDLNASISDCDLSDPSYWKRRHSQNEHTLQRLRSPTPSPVSLSLLDDFKLNKEKYQLQDIISHVVEFSTDQYGSRFIQKQLEQTHNKELKDLIFQQVVNNLFHLISNVFGNYVVQKFIEVGDDNQRSIIVQQISGKVIQLSTQMYACRVIQKILEYIPLQQQLLLINELKGHVLELVKDQNGNHVIQKAIEKIPMNYIEFIINSLKNNIYQLSTNPYGCRIIQRILENCKELKYQLLILNDLEKFIPYLIQDLYGNYVIQHIVESSNLYYKNLIINIIMNNLLIYSKHKFASNVVEKCIMYCSPVQLYDFIRLIITPINQSNNNSIIPINEMMKDQFANYVIQKLLEVSNYDQKIVLVSYIKPCLQHLKRYNGSKRLASIERLIAISEEIVI